MSEEQAGGAAQRPPVKKEDLERHLSQLEESLGTYERLLVKLSSGEHVSPTHVKIVDEEMRRILSKYSADDSVFPGAEMVYKFKDCYQKYFQLKADFGKLNKSFLASHGIEIPELNADKPVPEHEISSEDFPDLGDLLDILGNKDKNDN